MKWRDLPEEDRAEVIEVLASEAINAADQARRHKEYGAVDSANAWDAMEKACQSAIAALEEAARGHGR